MRHLRFCQAAFLAMSLTLGISSPVRAEVPALHALASPTGIATVGFLYAISTAVSNILWAFDWTDIGVSANVSKRIQEAGGLSAAAEALLLGFFIPFIAYFHLKTHNKAPTHSHTELRELGPNNV